MNLYFTVSPFVHQSGTIKVPDSLTESEWAQYIKEHFHEAELGEMDISYRGIDIDDIEILDE